MIRGVLGSQAPIGGVLGQGRGGAAAQWWLSGGVSASNAIAVYQPKGAASLAASYTNLANPGTYTAAPGVAPTFDTATGWTFAGAYLNSGVVPGNGWSVLCRFSGVSANSYLLGARSSGDNGWFLAVIPGSNYLQYSYGSRNNATPNMTSGIFGMAGATCYRNGVSDGSVSGTTTTTYQTWIGTFNNAGSFVNGSASTIQAVAIYNATLSAAQVSSISAAMAAL